MSNGWTIKKLGELLNVKNGFAFNSKQFSANEGVPLIRIRDLKSEGKTATCYSGEYDNKYLVYPGDLLIGMDGEFVCHEWKGPEALLNQRVCRLEKFSPELLPRFLYYGINKFLKDIEDVTTYTTVKHISARQINEIDFPLPSLNEQKRIVAILDEAFAGIETAIDNTEKNLVNARELFESYLHTAFSQQTMGWKRTTVGEQITLQRGFDITKKQQNPGIVPVVSSGGTKSFHDKAKVEGPGVVIGRKGSLGTAYYVENDFWPHDTVLWVKEFNSNSPKFVYYFLRSLDVKGLDSGTANPALNRNMVHPIGVSWPDRRSQERIVDNLDGVSGETERLGAIYKQKLTALTELKQSLLQKAFSGELTADKAEGEVREAVA